MDFRPLSERGIAAVHEASLAVLARSGLRFASPRAIELFRRNAFRVEGQRVFFAESDLRDALEKVPRRFTILARNPRHHLELARGVSALGLGRGALNMVGPDGRSRRATTEDLIEATKLCQSLEALKHWEPLVEPCDVSPANAHLASAQAMAKYTDKPYNYSGWADIELVALCYGTTPRAMAQRASLAESYGQATVTTLSPLALTAEDCENLFRYAECGIAFHIASMPIAGATGPCTLTGLVVQQNCENLGAIVLAQLVRPGCPVFYGSIGGHADMRTMRPVFGSADSRLIERAGAQMAAHYGLLCRGNTGLTDSLACDFQAGAQAAMHALAILGHGPEFLTGCGLLGSYLGASLAKIVLDVELIEQAARLLVPLPLDEESLAVEVMAEVGPGGQYVDHAHTLAHCRTEFLAETCFGPASYERSAERKDAVRLAHEKAQALIASYRRPPMDPELEAEIDGYVRRHWKSC